MSKKDPSISDPSPTPMDATSRGRLDCPTDVGEDDPPLKTDQGVSVEEKALGISEIIGKIMASLPTSDLIGLRRVSGSWNEEALRHFPSRVRCSIGKIEVLIGSSFASLYFQRSRHWRLDWENEEYDDCHVERNTLELEEQKVLDNLTSVLAYFEGRGTKAESLLLSRPLWSDVSYKIVEQALAAVKESLAALTVDVYWRRERSRPFPFQVSLSALQALTLMIHPTHGWRDKFFGFLDCADSIASLTIIQQDDGILAGCEPEVAVLVEKIASLQTDPSRLGHLTKVSIVEYFGWKKERVRLFVALASLREKSLRSLHIGAIPPRNNKVNLRRVLERQRESLEELSLHLKTTTGLRPHLGRRFVVKFPGMMEKLLSLSVLFSRVSPIQRSFLEEQAPIAFKFGFGGHEVHCIDYGRHFPAMSHLRVWPSSSPNGSMEDDVDLDLNATSWGHFEHVLAPFIQPAIIDGRFIPQPGIRRLDIPLVLKGDYNSILDGLEDTFPNANNIDLLRDARGRPARGWNDPEERD